MRKFEIQIVCCRFIFQTHFRSIYYETGRFLNDVCIFLQLLALFSSVVKISLLVKLYCYRSKTMVQYSHLQLSIAETRVVVLQKEQGNVWESWREPTRMAVVLAPLHTWRKVVLAFPPHAATGWNCLLRQTNLAPHRAVCMCCAFVVPMENRQREKNNQSQCPRFDHTIEPDV